MPEPGYIVLYRWRLRPGREEQFEAAWSIVTQALIGHGSLGSRLHRGDDGLWYAYAQWPSAEARDQAFAAPDPLGAPDGLANARASMAAAVAQHFPELVLAPTVDLLRPTAPAARLRVARPTTDIDRAVAFWTGAVGFELLSRFEDHNGYDGAILGYPGASWELEVTRQGSGAPVPTPTPEDIIALYVPAATAIAMTARLADAGAAPFEHENPYWAAMGATAHTDPDGYTLIVYPLE